MANQSNYPDKIPSLVNYRPNRLSLEDYNFLLSGKKPIIFGTDSRDKVELWLYNPDGSFATHANIPVTSDSLGLTTVVDNVGAFEFLDMNLQKIANLIGIEPGRYSLVANFLRDEVGSEETYQLSIQEISDDRTELKVSSNTVSEEIQQDICEFITPSVSKIFAQGLIDQTFGVAFTETTTAEEVITVDKMIFEIHSLISQFIQRTNHADADIELRNMITLILPKVRNKMLDLMAKDVQNSSIQQTELIQYIINALILTISEMKQKNLIDNRFEIV